MPVPPSLVPRRIVDRIDPAELFAALERRSADLFWLDAGADATRGWSILGVGAADPDVAAPGRVRIDTPAPRAADEPPFRGGWVGWLDYETGAVAVGAPVASSGRSAAWLRVERAVAFDHSRGRAWALGPQDETEAWARELADLVGTSEPGPPYTTAAPAWDVARAEARHSPAEYAGLIERCRDAIRAGRAYQLCLTTRFEVPGAHDPVQTYLRLRAATPAHHGGFVRIEGTALLSASPELFLDTGGGRVRTRPIKGTRPRGADPASDAALARELAESAKERAENVMIVDLMRNDLSRVCVPGSIRVDGLWQVESYAAVHQLVSTVSGRLRPGTTAADLWEAAFPAGSMTGAPKLSAMTLLHELEAAPRGVYSGCFGHVGLNGDMDLAMVIRSIVLAPTRAVVGAGGGITWGSEAEAEVAEVATKARAPLAALGASLPAEWTVASDILE